MAGQRPSLTLSRFFAIIVGGLGLTIVVLISLFYQSSRSTLLAASERLMGGASARVVDSIERHLSEAEETEAALERQVQAGIVRTEEPETLERVLAGLLLANGHLTEVTFTRAAGQSSAYRAGPGPGAAVMLRRIARENGVWRSRRRSLAAGRSAMAEPASDPTAHLTFTTPAEPENRGHLLWSDLAYSQLDESMPEEWRRRVVTVQRALWEGDRLVGVARVALLSDRIDELVRLRVEENNPDDPHRVFLCDRQGRLVARMGPRDTFATLDTAGRVDATSDDLRVRAAALPEAIGAALGLPELPEMPSGTSLQRLAVTDGRRYLVNLSAMPDERTQGWVVGVVAPESHYLADLQAARTRMLLVAAALLLLAGGGGTWASRRMRGDLTRLVAETGRMGGFHFEAGTAGGSFADIAQVLDGLEQAKTALRAMTKYVPLDLVRQLYQARIEPTLGGKLQELSILFSDVEGFTSTAEGMEPDQLASALGRYLEVMTRAVHESGGIVDKYLGDGVMALWNAPEPRSDHARRACAAALRCMRATDELFRSPEWEGLPPWKTRVGVHRAEVSVGHFGAPDRMSFTAMGDGVNLSARLESLNKQYGTRILVSAAVKEVAGEGWVFRRVDRVAVKGKSRPVEIYELIDFAGQDEHAWIARYERALDAYFDRRFTEALGLLSTLESDRPSAVLAQRCRGLLANPPAQDWGGVYVALEK